MFTTPILFLIFNRPETTAPVFEQIRKLKPKYLYVAADGPRPNKVGEQELCKASQAIIFDNIDWDCEIKTLVRDKNIGCKNAVSQAITWFFENVERGIILEDDCLPDQSFFTYCEELLERYSGDEDIISIGGTNLGYAFENDDSYSYSRYMNMWGWASWRRSSLLIDYNMEKWKSMRLKDFFLFKRTQQDLFYLDVSGINYWKSHFDLTASGKLNTWDYQWIFAQMYNKKKSIFPACNLIKNIGFTDKATHTPFPDHPIASLPLRSLQFPLKHPKNVTINKYYEEEYLKKIWFGYEKEPLFKILKTRLLYIPIIHKLNNYFKKQFKVI